MVVVVGGCREGTTDIHVRVESLETEFRRYFHRCYLWLRVRLMRGTVQYPNVNRITISQQ